MTQPDLWSTPPFDGRTIDHEKDHGRLAAQLGRVRTLMLDSTWRTLPEIEAITHDPQASVSARLRDLRKQKFGGYTVERRRRSEGLHEYRVLLPKAAAA
jgi:hypothetical protein